MTKRDKIEILMLLSAIESLLLAEGRTPPDYLIENLNNKVEVLTEDVLED